MIAQAQIEQTIERIIQRSRKQDAVLTDIWLLAILRNQVAVLGAWVRFRVNDETGSGQADATAVPADVLAAGEGVFWRQDSKRPGIVYLRSPQHVIEAMRKEGGDGVAEG